MEITNTVRGKCNYTFFILDVCVVWFTYDRYMTPVQHYFYDFTAGLLDVARRTYTEIVDDIAGRCQPANQSLSLLITCRTQHLNADVTCLSVHASVYIHDILWTRGGTHYVRVMGRLRGIDPPFSRHWKKISILENPFSRCLRKISILDPFFMILRKKVNLRPLFSPRHRL